MSRYASAAYLALLRLGTAEAKHVSEIAKIPPAKVYATLERLQERGLVTVSPGKPRKYTPVPMKEFLRREIEAQREQVEALAAREREISSLFPILGTVEVEDRASITTVRGRRNISEHVREHAAAARKEMLLVLPTQSAGRLRGIGKVISAARSRGVSVRILASGTREDARSASGGAEVHATGPGIGPDVAFAIFDDETAILAHFISGQASRSAPKDVGIVTSERAIVATLADLVRSRWASSPDRERPVTDAAVLAQTLGGLDGTYILVDEAGRIAMCTRGRRAAVAFSQEGAVGRPFAEVLPDLAEADALGRTSLSWGEQGVVRFSKSQFAAEAGGQRRLFHLEGADASVEELVREPRSSTQARLLR